MSIRDRVVALAPVWLRRKWGARLLWGLGLQFDAAATLLAASQKSCMPDYAPPDALPILGNDRGIVRGFAEPEYTYRQRLKLWQASRLRKGTRFAIMEQLAAYIFPFYRVYIVQGKSDPSPGFFGYIERSVGFVDYFLGLIICPNRWHPIIDLVYSYPFMARYHFAPVVDMTAQRDGSFVVPTVTVPDMLPRTIADTMVELSWEWGSAHGVVAAVFLAFPAEAGDESKSSYSPPNPLLHRTYPDGIIIGRKNRELSSNPQAGTVESEFAAMIVETSGKPQQFENIAVEYFVEWETYAEHEDHTIVFETEIQYRTGAGPVSVVVDTYTHTVPQGQRQRATVRRVARYTLPSAAIAWHVRATVIDQTDFAHTLHGTAMLAIHTNFKGL